MDNLAVCAKTLHVVTVTCGQTKLKKRQNQFITFKLFIVVTICTVVKLKQAYRRPEKKITLVLYCFEIFNFKDVFPKNLVVLSKTSFSKDLNLL